MSRWQAGARRLATIAGAASTLALPPRCPGCGTVTSADHLFCAACWPSLRFLAPIACRVCGLPGTAPDGGCATCAPPMPGEGMAAAVAYGPVARAVALRLKYGGRIALAETMARLMRPLLPATVELLVPVPLHRGRLWARGFNQAALIAAALGRAAGIPSDPLVLRRQRATPVLRGLDPAARRAAVAGAFALDPARAPRLAGRAVALIDDVHTTGATAAGCAAAIRAAGAASVFVLCWARVLPADRDD